MTVPTELPVIDLASIMEAQPTCFGDKQPDLKGDASLKLVQALRTTGFAYIKNHGLPRSELAEAFAMSKKFFDLPMEDKMRAPHPPGWAVHRGYSKPGLEKVSNAKSNGHNEAEQIETLREIEDYKESYEVGAENFTDMPNVWLPDNVLPEWKPFMTGFYAKCLRISSKILESITLGLGLEEDTLLHAHSGINGQLRLLHYPPIPVGAIDKGKLARMPAHSDWSTLTILFQDDCGGLQIEKPDAPGSFIDVTPIEGTLVLNVGDLLMRWSNDYLKSTQHRVALPASQGEGDLSRARYSIPFFLAPDPDVVIKCLDLGGGFKPKYEPITQREYASMRAKMQY